MSGPSEPGRPAADPPPRRGLPGDVVVGACILVFCAVAYAVTSTFDEAPAALAQNVQPARFPQLVLAVMAVLTLVVMARGFVLPEPRRDRVKAMVIASAAVMVGFVLAIDALGFFEATAVLCLVLPLLWGERRLYLLLPYAVGLPTALWLLFVQVLDVHFPRGLIAQLLA